MIKNILLVGLGGGIGSILRYTTTMLIGAAKIPYATLLVNVIGSFVIGLVIAFGIKDENFAGNWKLFLATGICGGFTTFSAFSADNMQLLQSGKTGLAFLYITVSVVLSIAATFGGYQLLKN